VDFIFRRRFRIDIGNILRVTPVAKEAVEKAGLKHNDFGVLD
jgi:hypothetical protein